MIWSNLRRSAATVSPVRGQVVPAVAQEGSDVERGSPASGFGSMASHGSRSAGQHVGVVEVAMEETDRAVAAEARGRCRPLRR